MPEWYIEIFIGLLCDFLTDFDRSCLDRISFKDMRLCSDNGLEVTYVHHVHSVFCT